MAKSILRESKSFDLSYRISFTERQEQKPILTVNESLMFPRNVKNAFLNIFFSRMENNRIGNRHLWGFWIPKGSDRNLE